MVRLSLFSATVVLLVGVHQTTAYGRSRNTVTPPRIDYGIPPLPPSPYARLTAGNNELGYGDELAAELEAAKGYGGGKEVSSSSSFQKSHHHHHSSSQSYKSSSSSYGSKQVGGVAKVAAGGYGASGGLGAAEDVLEEGKAIGGVASKHGYSSAQNIVGWSKSASHSSGGYGGAEVAEGASVAGYGGKVAAETGKEAAEEAALEEGVVASGSAGGYGSGGGSNVAVQAGYGKVPTIGSAGYGSKSVVAEKVGSGYGSKHVSVSKSEHSYGGKWGGKGMAVATGIVGGAGNYGKESAIEEGVLASGGGGGYGSGGSGVAVQAGYGKVPTIGAGGYGGKGGVAVETGKEAAEEAALEEGVVASGGAGGYGSGGGSSVAVQAGYGKVPTIGSAGYGSKSVIAEKVGSGYGSKHVSVSKSEHSYGSYGGAEKEIASVGSAGGYGGKGGVAVETGYGKEGAAADDDEAGAEESEEGVIASGGGGGYGGSGGAGVAVQTGYGKIPTIPGGAGGYGGKGGVAVETGYGKEGGYGGEVGTQVGGYEGSYGGGYKKSVIKTKMTTVTCNKMIDHILDSFQQPFQQYMSQYKVDHLPSIRMGHWGRVSLFDGKIDHFGKICRKDNFKIIDQGDDCYAIEGVIMVPQPMGTFCANAYLYNRFKVRDRSLNLCAKEASFKVMMNVDKQSGRVHVAELEPVSLTGFHLEDGHSKSGALLWPFSRITSPMMEASKLHFMYNLQGQLCDQFRAMIHKPQIQQQIIQQV